jgi:transcription antitermination factor NusG
LLGNEDVMTEEQSRRPPLVIVTDGPFAGHEGPVVGIDQEKGTVQIQTAKLGVVFRPKQITIEVDVRKVRRLDASS